MSHRRPLRHPHIMRYTDTPPISCSEHVYLHSQSIFQATLLAYFALSVIDTSSDFAWHMSIRVGNQLVYWLASKRCCPVTPLRTCLPFVIIFAWLFDRCSVVSTEVSIAFLYKETV
ncbi:unnamed protein product [Dicrocoelium dendriticum]|nr:unnamed protein product [Dicrocoelium dendriticum]